MATRLLLIAALSTALILPGCIADHGSFSSSAIAKKYTDADERVADNVQGSAHESETIQIPVGTKSLRVAATYNVDGSGHLVLRSPTGDSKKSESFAGSASKEDSDWFSMSNPTPGNWKLELSVAGDASYAFGFYI